MTANDRKHCSEYQIPREKNLLKLAEQLNALMCYNLNSKDSKYLAAEINPYFHNLFMCGYFSMDDHPEIANQDLIAKCNEFSNTRSPFGRDDAADTKIIYSFVPYKRGSFIIYSMSTLRLSFGSGISELLCRAGIDSPKLRLGLSLTYEGTENIAFALKEAVFANTACILNNVSLLRFAEMGQDRLLMPTRFDPWVERYCQHMDSKLYPYSVPQKCDVTKTLEAYVECGGDIGLTAKLTGQHGNTIRYRMSKIRSILGMVDALNFDSEICTYIRLVKMRPYLEPFFRNAINK